MNYDGGKNGAGIPQLLINQIPPHRVFVELFCGSAPLTRHKRPAAVNIIVDCDLAALTAVQPFLPAEDPPLIVWEDALQWLKSFAAAEDVFIYADPPYLRSTRSGQRDLYRYEFAEPEQHEQLLALAVASPARWMISGYWSELYATRLRGWRSMQFDSTTRAGTRREWLWLNFPSPAELHDYRFLGTNRTERQRIHRKIASWTGKLSRLPALERNAVFAACQEAQLKAAAPDRVARG